MDDSPGMIPGDRTMMKNAIPAGTRLYSTFFDRWYTAEERVCTSDPYSGKDHTPHKSWALVNPMGTVVCWFGKERRRAEEMARYENDRLRGRFKEDSENESADVAAE